MYFENVSALIAMNGHGPYVWSAYAVTTLVLLSLIINPLLRKKRLLLELRMLQRREQQFEHASVSSVDNQSFRG